MRDLYSGLLDDGMSLRTSGRQRRPKVDTRGLGGESLSLHRLPAHRELGHRDGSREEQASEQTTKDSREES